MRERLGRRGAGSRAMKFEGALRKNALSANFNEIMPFIVKLRICHDVSNIITCIFTWGHFAKRTQLIAVNFQWTLSL
jgi:hypothetical protein